MVKKKPQIAGATGARTEMNRRVTSGAFTQLNPGAIRELKDSFTLLDRDGDGSVGKDDLEEMLVSLGQEPDDEYISKMLSRVASPLTFSAYLTTMSSQLNQVSNRQELLDAFEAFDENGKGKIDTTELGELLVERGMSLKDIQAALAPFTSYSGYNYRDFVNLLHSE